MALKVAGLGTYTLAGSISSTQTSITLSSFTVPITGTDVTMASMGTSIAYGTISPGTANSEFISFTGITQNSDGTATLTGVTRGLDKQSPYTTSSSFKRPHSGQAQFILSDSPNLWDSLAIKQNDETITGKYTFPNDANTPVIGASYVAPTTQTQVASKGYVDSVAIAGAPNATTSVQGLVELATQAEYDARTATGGTGASLVATPALNRAVLTHDYAADAGSTDAYAITLTPAVTAYTAGDIYYFKANTINTGACTLNVNGLGAKALKYGGSDPYDGLIRAGSYVQCQYDGTNMNIIWCSSAVPISQKSTEIYAVDSVGTDAYAVTLIPAPAAYTDGMVVNFKAGTSNTGAATLNVNSLGAVAILKNGTLALTDNDIIANQVVQVIYDGTNFQLQTPIAGITGAMPTLTNSSISTNTTSTIFSYTVPPLLANALVRVELPFSYAPGSSGTYVATATYGGSTVATGTVVTNVTGGDTGSSVFTFSFKNNNSTSSQICSAFIVNPSSGVFTGNGFICTSAVYTAGGTLSVASSSSQTLTVSVTASGVSGSSMTFSKPIIQIMNQS